MNSLQALLAAYPLPTGWSPPELHQKVGEAESLRLQLTGLLTDHPQWGRAYASAADPGEAPLLRCYFELLERIAILEAENDGRHDFTMKGEDGEAADRIARSELFLKSDAPATWQYSRSNGVAAHHDWFSACRNAQLELVERDRLLRSWFGQISPVEIPFSPPVADPRYRFRQYSFADPGDPYPIFVHGLFGFPENEGLLLAYGLGAGWSAEEASSKAAREFLQMYGFLLGEKADPEEPAFAPNPSYHQALNFRPEGRNKILGWLAGRHSAFARQPGIHDKMDPKIRFADITPISLERKIFVAKAFSAARIPLTFGRARLKGAENLPEPLLIHPFV